MKKRTLKLKTLPTNIHFLEKFIEEICDEYNINNTYFGNILVTLTEALENANIHGNKSNPEKEVYVSFESVSKGLLFEVTDQGDGFDYTNIPDATDPVANPDRKGTGLFLIRSLADEINFRDNGKTIQILFYISSINQQIAADRINQLNTYKTSDQEIKEKQ